MNNQEAYNAWSQTYDTVENKTRDLEAKALREMLSDIENADILEIGCGTGKNTEFLLTKANQLIGADFSTEMLGQAKLKILAENVAFQQMDLRENWSFAKDSFDLITCSLALEHIENIDFVFSEASKVLRSGGKFYIGELHPFKQYLGSKARFETNSGVFELECFVHHFSEYAQAGLKNNFTVSKVIEWFDENEPRQIPRLLTMIFTLK